MTKAAKTRTARRAVPPTPIRKAPRIQSLARADAILDIVASTPHAAVRLSEISSHLALSKTTVFSLAESLVSLGYLSRDATVKGYRLGLRNLELGRTVARQMDIVDLCRPSLIRLCRDTGETANLALPYLNDAMIVESYESKHGVRATAYAGTRACYHSTACGKAILGHLNERVRRQLYDSVGLAAMTPNTITDPELLERDLARLSRDGFSLEVEENEIGASCVGVPVLDSFGQPAASFSVAGVVQRMTPAAVRAIADLMLKEAKQVEQALRGEPPTVRMTKK